MTLHKIIYARSLSLSLSVSPSLGLWHDALLASIQAFGEQQELSGKTNCSGLHCQLFGTRESLEYDIAAIAMSRFIYNILEVDER